MSQVPPIDGQIGTQRVTPTAYVPAEHAPHVPPQATTDDEVEISPAARALSLLEATPDIRAEKVALIRNAIRDGSYNLDDKLDDLVDRLLEELREG